MSNITLNSEDNVILNIRPTIFIDLNKKNGLAADHQSTAIRKVLYSSQHFTKFMNKIFFIDS